MNPLFDPFGVYTMKDAVAISGLSMYRLRQYLMNKCITFHFYANGRILLDGASLNDLMHTILWHPHRVPYKRRWLLRLHHHGLAGTMMGNIRPCPPTCLFIP